VDIEVVFRARFLTRGGGELLQDTQQVVGGEQFCDISSPRALCLDRF
jgi:hypothetical protein